MQQIPEELVSDVLGYLSGYDLRTVAGVDRRLYRAAQDAGCLILRTVDLAHPATLSAFQEIVKYTAGKDPRDRPGLGLRLFVNCTATTRSAFEPHFQLALTAIQASIRLLVHLEAYVPSFFAEDLHATLRSGPAPLLRILALGQACRGHAPAVAIPGDLFENTAPHLRTVFLIFPTLEAQWQPVAVFKNVRTARLTLYRTNHPVRVARLLPRVRSLVVDFGHNKPPPETRPELNISGTNLQRLTMVGRRELEGALAECTISGIAVTQLPVFECGGGTAYTHSLRETMAPSDAPVRARITSARFTTPATPARALTLESAGCMRTAFGDGMVHSPIDGARAIGIGTRLTVIMLDSPAYLDVLLAVQTPLLALAELYVNIAGHSSLLDSPCVGPDPVSAVRCPALQVVTLFVGEDYKVYALHANNVAEFGQTLGLDAAVLRMVHPVAFVQPMPRKRLASVFPVVEFPEKLDLQGARLAAPRDCHVERLFFVPDFVVRDV